MDFLVPAFELLRSRVASVLPGFSRLPHTARPTLESSRTGFSLWGMARNQRTRTLQDDMKNMKTSFYSETIFDSSNPSAKGSKTTLRLPCEWSTGRMSLYPEDIGSSIQDLSEHWRIRVMLSVLPLVSLLSFADALARSETQSELQKLRDELKYWKFRYGDLLEMYTELSNQPSLIEDLPSDEKTFMPGNVQHCRNQVAAITPTEGTNPKLEPNVNYSNYSYVVYSPRSRYASNLEKSFSAADATLEKVKHVGRDSLQIPSIMFDIDNTLAYTGFNDTDILGKAPPIVRAVNFAKRWCRFGEKSEKPFECFFITARYCTQLKANATKIWVKENFPVDDEWIRKHVFMTGAIGGCKSEGCSVAYKAVLRNWLHAERQIYWMMSVGDQLTDSAGLQSGVRVKVPNFWFDSSIVPNPQENGGQIRLQADRSFAPDTDECKLKCVIGPDNECIVAGMKNDAIHKYTELEYCLDQDSQKVPDQQKGCSINLLTLKRTC